MQAKAGSPRHPYPHYTSYFFPKLLGGLSLPCTLKEASAGGFLALGGGVSI